MKTTYIIILFMVALNFSCSEELKPTPYTYTQIFTGENSKTWKLKFLEETLNGEIIETFTINCASDDKYTFYANPERSYEATTGSKKCSDGEANTITDSWSFNNASATLTMLLPFFTTEGSLPFIVKEAKKNKMELEIFFDEEGTESYRVHFEATDED
ncbi:MAG TPA: hypothetical protein PLJ60_15615 [Chryseolinea sp.]|nr:hypothetical protein [Flavobacteriales bacterium]HPM31761.1 hypothetical protein [Chryseolinea sp.]